MGSRVWDIWYFFKYLTSPLNFNSSAKIFMLNNNSFLNTENDEI